MSLLSVPLTRERAAWRPGPGTQHSAAAQQDWVEWSLLSSWLRWFLDLLLQPPPHCPWPPTPLSALSPQRGLLLLPPEQPCEVTDGALNLRLEPDSDQGSSETWPYDLSFTNIVCFLCGWFLSAWPTGASLPGMTAPQMTAAETPQDRERQTFSVKG